MDTRDLHACRIEALERHVTRLRRLLGGLVAAVLISVVTAFTRGRALQRPHFDEIDVERINIVERDGTVRLIVSNNARSPGLVVRGRRIRPDGGRGAGLMFYNDEGEESGGLHYGARRDPNGTVSAGSALNFDRYDQDQTISLAYQEGRGSHSAGLSLIDRPDTPMGTLVDRVAATNALPDGPDKTLARRALDSLSERGEFGATRVFVGTAPTRTATLRLADARGKTRLRLLVDSLGAARIEFLDDSGRVTRQLAP